MHTLEYQKNLSLLNIKYKGDVMFTGLTWFGIPLEYLLRFSEITFTISIILSIYSIIKK